MDAKKREKERLRLAARVRFLATTDCFVSFVALRNLLWCFLEITDCAALSAFRG